MSQKYPIDSEWFHRELRSKKKTVSELARFLSVDKSAASRMLKGERKMSAEEQDKVAQFLGVGIADVVAHRTGSQQGFSEMQQSDFVHGKTSSSGAAKESLQNAGSYSHPIFGCMKGTMTIPDDLDLTAPIDAEWGDKLYNE